MNIKPFAVEEWMNTWETKCEHNIAETCVDSLSMDELFKLTDTSKHDFLSSFSARRLTYGDIEGYPALLEGIASLYETVKPEHIITTHGAAGANALVLETLVKPNDHVVAMLPTYQQLYSIPEMCGARVDTLTLSTETNYRIDVEKLRTLCTPDTHVICINNPNNPTGALIPEQTLQEIIEIARACDAWIVCDEVYRHLTQEDIYQKSVADLYEKSICTSSMSKVFSLAGVRVGWCVTKDPEMRRELLSHRDYTFISGSLFDEALAAHALAHKDILLSRSKTIVRQNIKILEEWVHDHNFLSLVTPQAGTTALVHYDADIPSYELCEYMMTAHKTLVTPGDCFGMPYSFRVGYGYSSDPKGLIEGLSHASAAITEMMH